MAPKNAINILKAMKAMKTMKAMKKGKFMMKEMKALKALKAKKKAAEKEKIARMKAAGCRYDGQCPDTGIHWWVHPDDEPFIDRGFVGD